MELNFEGTIALARSCSGPLSSHLPAFVASLIEQRYAVVSVRAKAWNAVAFDAWLSAQGIELICLSESHIDRFHRRRYHPRSDCRTKPRIHEPTALRHLLRLHALAKWIHLIAIKAATCGIAGCREAD